MNLSVKAFGRASSSWRAMAVVLMLRAARPRRHIPRAACRNIVETGVYSEVLIGYGRGDRNSLSYLTTDTGWERPSSSMLFGVIAFDRKVTLVSAMRR